MLWKGSRGEGEADTRAEGEKPMKLFDTKKDCVGGKRVRWAGVIAGGD